MELKVVLMFLVTLFGVSISYPQKRTIPDELSNIKSSSEALIEKITTLYKMTWQGISVSEIVEYISDVFHASEAIFSKIQDLRKKLIFGDDDVADELVAPEGLQEPPHLSITQDELSTIITAQDIYELENSRLQVQFRALKGLAEGCQDILNNLDQAESSTNKAKLLRRLHVQLRDIVDMSQAIIETVNEVVTSTSVNESDAEEESDKEGLKRRKRETYNLPGSPPRNPVLPNFEFHDSRISQIKNQLESFNQRHTSNLGNGWSVNPTGLHWKNRDVNISIRPGINGINLSGRFRK